MDETGRTDRDKINKSDVVNAERLRDDKGYMMKGYKGIEVYNRRAEFHHKTLSSACMASSAISEWT